MREITAETAADYLRESGRVPNEPRSDVRELSGGVSNIVLRVDVPGQPPFVIKQCRERLRVAMDWRARLDRIWTEHATLELLRSILPEGTVPQVLFEDRPNYLFAMTCAPDDAVTWKTHLMAGQVDPDIAAPAGHDPGHDPRRGPGHPALRGTLADTSLFDELRVDPYYRTTAARASGPGPAHRCLDRRHGSARGRANARPGRLQPQEHPGALGRPDPARLRVRTRGRPGVRPGVLPEPSPAQDDPRGLERSLASPSRVRSSLTRLFWSTLSGSARIWTPRRGPS